MPASGQTTTIESLSHQGTPGNGWSQDAKLSADGSVIVFASSANNLVPDDTGGTDIFVRNRAGGAIRRLSTRADGTAAPGAHWHPDISPDVRFVVFSSDATTLVTPSTTGRHIYLRDRDSDGNGVFDETAGVSLELISVSTDGVRANGDSGMPVISADGRYVAFHSFATNLVDGDTNNALDVFLRDRVTGTTLRLSTGLGGGAGAGISNVPNISRDGRYVIFQSNAPDLVPGDTNATTDIFRYSTVRNVVERVSTSSVGAQLDGGSVLGSEAVVGPCLSADGQQVVFQSQAANAVANDINNQIDVFAKDLLSGRITRISMRYDGTESQYPNVSPTISSDGRFVIFATTDGGIVQGDTNRRQDLFRRDRDSDANGVLDDSNDLSIQRISLGSGGVQPTLACYGGRPCDDGHSIIFTTTAGNMVDGDTNGFPDVFFSVPIPPSNCPSDFDQSGATDGDDVIAFATSWDSGNADIDASGSTDGDDLIVFFSYWDAGC